MNKTYNTPAEAINNSLVVEEQLRILAVQEITDRDDRAAQILDMLVSDIDDNVIDRDGRPPHEVVEDVLIRALIMWRMERMYKYAEFSLEKPNEPHSEEWLENLEYQAERSQTSFRQLPVRTTVVSGAAKTCFA